MVKLRATPWVSEEAILASEMTPLTGYQPKAEPFHASKLNQIDNNPVKASANQFWVHIILIFGQIVNGSEAVFASLFLPSGFNPLLFVLILLTCVAPALLFSSYMFEVRGNESRPIPNPVHHTMHFLATGACFFMYNVFYMAGVEVSDAITGSLWQCSQSVFGVMMTSMLGWEQLTGAKIGGIMCGLVGAAALITIGQGDSGTSTPLIGHLFFFFNCAAYALYVIWVRVLVRTYPPLLITGISCSLAAGGVALITLLQYDSSSQWTFPTDDSGAVFVIAFFILGCTFNWGAVSWATKHASDTSYCLAYSPVQPLSAFLLSLFFVLVMHWNDTHSSNAIAEPGWNSLGAIGILGSVLLFFWDTRSKIEDPSSSNEKPIPVASAIPAPANEETSPLLPQESTIVISL